MRARPSTEPMTIPAMAPPDRRCGSPAAAGVLVGVEVMVAVEVGKLIVGVMEGRVTPAHRVVTLEL